MSIIFYTSSDSGASPCPQCGTRLTLLPHRHGRSHSDAWVTHRRPLNHRDARHLLAALTPSLLQMCVRVHRLPNKNHVDVSKQNYVQFRLRYMWKGTRNAECFPYQSALLFAAEGATASSSGYQFKDTLGCLQFCVIMEKGT